MTLSKNDHVHVGIGHIYGPPFLARVLLYRLFESNCAVLIYHLKGGEVSDVFNLGKVQAVAAYGGQEPTQLRAHISSTSSSMELKDLLALPATQLALPIEGATSNSFGDVIIRVERFTLPFTEKLVTAYACLPQQELRISGSAYQVTGRVQIALWPDAVQSANLMQRCWKLSLCNLRHHKNYDLESGGDWSLTALDIEMEEAFQATHEVSLEKLRSAKSQN